MPPPGNNRVKEDGKLPVGQGRDVHILDDRLKHVRDETFHILAGDQVFLTGRPLLAGAMNKSA